MMQNLIIKGTSASPGIAIGKIFLIEDLDEFIPGRWEIHKNLIDSEIQRFKNAINETKNEISNLSKKVIDTLGKDYIYLIETQLLLLKDPIITKQVPKKIKEEQMNAEYVLYEVLEKVVNTLDQMKDDFFRERKHDIMDIGKKIMSHLLGKEKRNLTKIEEEVCVVARNISPSDILLIPLKFALGFATDLGGKTSHFALISKTLGIPTVVGLKDITKQAINNQTIIIDGNDGIAILNPEPNIIHNYTHRREIEVIEKNELKSIVDLPAETKDGHKITLSANIDSSTELDSIIENGAEGVGLYRTELLYITKNRLPTEEELFNEYIKIVQGCLPYSVIFRTIDLGGDKFASLGIRSIRKESNPFLGLRSIRFCLKYPDILKTQLSAILRASVYGNIKIMFPFISSVEEVRCAKNLIKEVKDELKHHNIDFSDNIEIGAMIELPSAALSADIIAKEVDFLSIGTNDLVQYLLGVDRASENVAELYDPIHPAVFKTMKYIIDAGHSNGKWVGMCGELAGEDQFAYILLGMGLDEFSVAPNRLLPIKKIIRNTSLQEAKIFVEQILQLSEKETLLEKIKTIKI